MTGGVSRGAGWPLFLALTWSGAHADALEVYDEAVGVLRGFGNRRNEARALIGLGEARQGLGRLTEARRSFAAAVEILQTLEDPQTAEPPRSARASRRIHGDPRTRA
jgi:tetratricopeptide (TPR) repeat protein